MLTITALAVALAQFIPPNTPLPPRTYFSPSRAWSLFVDPSHRYGGGKSTITISRQGKVQWAGEQPFTFHEAVINDEGVSAGYGYTHGEWADDGEMVIAIVGASGESLLVDETPRHGGGADDMGPSPSGEMMILQPERNIAVVCLPFMDRETGEDAWWGYQLSPAKKLDIEYPMRKLEEPKDHFHTMALAAVRGTPLTLAQWDLFHWEAKPRVGPGSEFALYDENWNLVWSLPLPGDCQRDKEDEEDALWREMRAHGGVIDTKSDRCFNVQQVATSESVTFEVARDSAAPTGWTVREVARVPFKLEPAKKEPELAKIELPEADPVAVDVGVTNASGAVRDIQNFTVDAAGKITFVRGEETAGAVSLVMLDANGRVVRQVAVAPIEPDAIALRTWTALADGDWLLIMSSIDPAMGSRAWRVRGETGGSAELTQAYDSEIESVAPTADGGFALLGNRRHDYGMSKVVLRCAADGSKLWELEESDEDDNPSALVSPTDVAVDKDGSLLVLDGLRKLVQFFDAKGTFVKALNFEKSWDSETSYLTDLIIEPSGTILIRDLRDGQNWRRLARDGTQLASFFARRENGDSAVGDSANVRVDPAGRMWGNDEHELFLYDEHGVAQARFGTAADPSALRNLDSAFLDGTGRLALADKRTHAVHLFNVDGHLSALCIPGAKDFEGEYSVAAVYTAPDGTIYVQPSRFNDSYLSFTPDGKRIGRVALGGKRLAFDRHTKERWAVGEASGEGILLRRYGVDGQVVFKTDRRPDGQFFGGLEALACAPDGSVAVLDERDHSAEVCFYSAKGEPQRQVALVHGEQGFDGHMQLGSRWLLIGDYSSTRVVSLIDDKCAMLTPTAKGGRQSLTVLGLSPDEKQVWALEWNLAVLHRFTLPK